MGLLKNDIGTKPDEPVEETERHTAEAVSAADETVRVEAPVEIAGIAAAPEAAAADDASAAEAQQSSVPDADAQAPPDGIRAFDQTGREVIVPREEWRTSVLPGMLRQAWEQPDQLYLLIVNSMNDGFFAEVADAAEHLFRTDTVPARGACMRGIVLTQTGRLEEAEEVLSEFVGANGEDGSVLTNLARVYAAQGQQEQAQSTLWRALELEPNLDSALGWYASLAQEHGGEQAALQALEQVRKLPASWRAQLWLARAELGAGRLEAARDLYTEALERAPRPVPGDLLMQMSGDLGGTGHLPELLEFTAPHFVPELHGLPVGNNLIKASLDTGDLDLAENIVRSLTGFERPDWKAPLEFWAGEIAARRGVSPGQELQIGFLRVDGALWLPAQSPAQRLFGVKRLGGPTVTFLGGTAEAPPAAEGMPPMADLLGRMSRALPLFLSEQVEMRGAANGRALLPWAVPQVSGQPGGFVVSGQRWPDEVAVQATSMEANRSDYVVSVHVDAEVEPWTADLVFVRTSDGKRIGELSHEFSVVSPEQGLSALATEVLELLGEAERADVQTIYEIPAGRGFGAYLLQLEQLLAVRCAGMEGVPSSFLTGEQHILQSALELCRSDPENAAARVLLVETVAAIRALRPEVASEFLTELQRLEAEYPLPAVAASFG